MVFLLTKVPCQAPQTHQLGAVGLSAWSCWTPQAVPTVASHRAPGKPRQKGSHLLDHLSAPPLPTSPASTVCWKWRSNIETSAGRLSLSNDMRETDSHHLLAGVDILFMCKEIGVLGVFLQNGGCALGPVCGPSWEIRALEELFSVALPMPRATPAHSKCSAKPRWWCRGIWARL